MYQIKDKVIYGLSGICEVIDISTIDKEDTLKSREYYTLQTKKTGENIRIPIDYTGRKLRSIISRDEAEELINKIPEIKPIKSINERMIEAAYKECLQNYNYEEWIGLIKFIYQRQQKRIQNKKNPLDLDEKYMKKVEYALYQELAYALGIEFDKVIDYIAEKVEKNK